MVVDWLVGRKFTYCYAAFKYRPSLALWVKMPAAFSFLLSICTAKYVFMTHFNLKLNKMAADHLQFGQKLYIFRLTINHRLEMWFVNN